MNEPEEKEEKKREEQAADEQQQPVPRWRPASEPTCCGSGCEDCPF